MRDDRFFKLSREERELDSSIKKLKAKQQKVRESITEEMERRDIKKIEGRGLRVTYRADEYSVFDAEVAEEILPPVIFEKIHVCKIDGKMFDASLSCGEITVDQARKICDIRTKRPWPQITFVEE